MAIWTQNGAIELDCPSNSILNCDECLPTPPPLECGMCLPGTTPFRISAQIPDVFSLNRENGLYDILLLRAGTYILRNEEIAVPPDPIFGSTEDYVLSRQMCIYYLVVENVNDVDYGGIRYVPHWQYLRFTILDFNVELAYATLGSWTAEVWTPPSPIPPHDCREMDGAVLDNANFSYSQAGVPHPIVTPLYD